MENEIGKKDIRITFHTYDFLGYFLPGAVFLSIIYVFEYLIKDYYKKDQFPPFYYITSLSKSYLFSSDSHWAFEIILIVLFIIFCYSLGHLIASIAAFFLDRLLVGKCFKYPYVILFKLIGNSSNKLKRVLFFLVFVTNILFLINLFFFQKQLFFISLGVIVLLGIISLSYINKIHVEEVRG
ncbi:MAG: hypothetical protein NUV92_10230 [Ignavibacteria bacterium]|jgi:hypothetical protein|nr:hypothetical protein [Ignavibacteria bacterium]MDH7527296.1 hypothetical protein [Ignavibacteria bacterium]